ncbi:MAG: hypothetical protein IPN29_02760 [Saprospiraceae bacterium]|nr:hypothetical protein [Saprospiraceae bacterium]
MQFVNANNVTIGDVIYDVPAAPGDPGYISFTLSWDNSWRVDNNNHPQNNMDGVLVFFKYRTETGEWQNLSLGAPSVVPFFGLPANFEYVSYGNAKIFHPSTVGKGSISGLFKFSTPALPYDIEIRAFAVEMVMIPSTYHYLGDGNQLTESTNAFHYGDNTYSYYGQFTNVDANTFDDEEIEAPNTFEVAFGLSSLNINNPNFPVLGVIWCMKYEISQGAYRDFLNTLNVTQQTTRTANLPTSAVGTGALTTSGNNRNFIEIKYPSIDGFPAVYGCDASGNNLYDEANDGEFVACNYLSWPDIAAWLDWAGLAPMTEIHFEKICKNNYFNAPIAGEYAWESKLINSSALTLSNPYTQSELVSNSSGTLGNAIFDMSGLDGPVRNGIFSVAITNRKVSGAAYYGVMDMSGNLTEACVTVGNVAARSYNKLGLPGMSRGDGTLSKWQCSGELLAGKCSSHYLGNNSYRRGDHRCRYHQSGRLMEFSKRAIENI